MALANQDKNKMYKQKNNKRADVQMVSYVVLIVISLSLSILVYSFLKSKTCVFGCSPKCPDDVYIIIEDAICQNNKLNLTVSNRGLFNISLLYVRMGNETKKIPSQISKNSTSLPSPLPPGGMETYIYNIPSNIGGAGKYFVEVQPALLSEKRTPMLCKNIPRQEVSCN